MPSYRYIVISRGGERLSGQIEAPSRQAAIDRLGEVGDFPVEIREAEPQRPQRAGSLFSRAPSGDQITLFTREFAMLLQSGVTISKALELLQTETEAQRMVNVIAQLRRSVTEGKSLSEALEKEGEIFPPVYVNMVKVAEATGSLDVVLERIADTREREQKMRSKALSALMYPALLVLVAVAAIIVMLVFVVPRFKDIIRDAGPRMPDSTRFVIAVSDWLVANGMTLAIALAAAVFVLLLLWQNRSFRARLQWLAFKLPLVGSLMRNALAARFCRTLGVLLSSGVGLPQALNLTGAVIDLEEAKRIVEEMGKSLRQGRDFTGPMSKSWLFPSLVVNLLRVGEEAGNLPRSSLHLAGMFEDKVDVSLQRLFTILEPAIIIIVSLFVAGIVVSIIGAVISVNDLAL